MGFAHPKQRFCEALQRFCEAEAKVGPKGF
jgi:hypothetical protein